CQHLLRPLGEGSHVGVGGGLVAGDDEQRDRLRALAFAFGGCGPRVGGAAAVGRARQVESARAGLVGKAELPRERGAMGSAGAFLARPDHDRALALAESLAELVRLARETAAGLDCIARVLDLGALAAGGAEPEVDDRRALGDR